MADKDVPAVATPSGTLLEEPLLYCPRCNNRLSELKCKLVCNRCHYYMSCADYY